MDSVQLRGLKLETLIGVHDWERRNPRPLLLDVTLSVDTRRAAASDALADGVDYRAVADLALAFAKEQRCQLVETFAERLAERLLAQFAGVASVRLTVNKPGAVAEAQMVGVTIERRRPGAAKDATD
ncbi:MAG TPA: dihydroneopterin aldolase [Candidatus Binatia bacterium]|nr:dihydroneopterin aldolase [Candidatus Binatia bacterium]